MNLVLLEKSESQLQGLSKLVALFKLPSMREPQKDIFRQIFLQDNGFIDPGDFKRVKKIATKGRGKIQKILLSWLTFSTDF